MHHNVQCVRLTVRSCMQALEIRVCPTATPVITRLASSTSGFID
jgi:hypothetical protein